METQSSQLVSCRFKNPVFREDFRNRLNSWKLTGQCRLARRFCNRSFYLSLVAWGNKKRVLLTDCGKQKENWGKIVADGAGMINSVGMVPEQISGFVEIVEDRQTVKNKFCQNHQKQNNDLLTTAGLPITGLGVNFAKGFAYL